MAINNPGGQALTEVLQYAAPSAGQTVVVAADCTILVVDPAGLLATLTINMPSAPSRGDGHQVAIAATQTVTALTLGAGAGNTIASGALTALSVGGFANYVYRATKWYRCG